jgi:hypothetical protein
MTPTSSPTRYATAHNLVGFASTTLRVKITRTSGDYVWVTTADLLDTGTALVLDTAQIEGEQPEAVIIHKNGLVAFG